MKRFHHATAFAASLGAGILASSTHVLAQTLDAATREHLAVTAHATHALLLAGTGDCEAADYAVPLCEMVQRRVSILAANYDPTTTRRAHEAREGRAFLAPAASTFGGDLLPLSAACGQYLQIHRTGRGAVPPSLDGLVVHSDTGRITAGGALAHALEVEQRCRPRATPTTATAPTAPPPPTTPATSRWGLSIGVRSWVPVMAPTTALFPTLPLLAVGPTLHVGRFSLALQATVGAMRSSVVNANTNAPQWVLAVGADLRGTWLLPLHARVGITLGAHAGYSYVHRWVERGGRSTTQFTNLALLGAITGVRLSLHRAVDLAITCDVDWVPLKMDGALHHTVQLSPELAASIRF